MAAFPEEIDNRRIIPVYMNGKFVGTARTESKTQTQVTIASNYDPHEKVTTSTCENNPAAVNALFQRFAPQRTKPKRDWSRHIRSLRHR